MEMLLTFFEETLIPTNKNIKSRFLSLIYSWKFKRMVLNIIWGLLNLSLLVYGTNLFIKLGYELPWVAGVLIYASCYWIVTTILFDAIIGDEIDHGTIK
tara:strand:+ start:2955 stop:3251 length:297 start_codon:yes stop_codon:yes gene_type:complete